MKAKDEVDARIESASSDKARLDKKQKDAS
jgi:hypothetical protein